MDIHHLSDIARRLAHKHAPATGGAVSADDLHQEGLVAGWRELQRGNPPSHAVVSARNAIIDHLRKHGPVGKTGTHRALPASDEEIAAAHWPATDDHADAVADRRWLVRCLARLTHREREVLVRYHLREETLLEIARRLRLSQARVSQIRLRALRRARECEDDHGA